MNLIDAFPADWRCDVKVKRGSGRNKDGDPTPAAVHVVPGCMVGARSTSDPTDRSDLTDTAAVLYALPRADFASTDTVVVPAEHFMAGTYAVDGDPGFWPLGTEVPLRRTSQ